MVQKLSRAGKKFYITTPIYYVNGLPHIGAAYTSIAADILARYHRAIGDEVRFLMGTDENAQKNVEAALSQNPKSETCLPTGRIRNSKLSRREVVQKYVDEMAAKWQEAWDELGLTHDDFIRTTEPRHIEYVEEFWKKCAASGDIYKGSYEGLYCKGCEAFKTETELINGLCPDHQRAPEKLREENYFFRLSKYQDALLKHIEEHPEFIQPEARRNEVVSYIKDHAKDFSISRENLEWGIPVPGDPKQTIYVWFDALLNYISADPKWWPADLHLVGKDIIKFHCAYWPAMLLSAGLALPKTVFAHGFFTIDGQKMSKTIGNVVDPIAITQKYGNDVLRYYLMREISFGGDGDFSEIRLRERYNGELANGIGNLTARVLTMVEKYAEGKVPKGANDESIANLRISNSQIRKLEDHSELAPLWQQYEAHMKRYELDRALDIVWQFIAQCDKMIDETQPWKLAKQDDKKPLFEVLYELAESIRHIGWMLLPFMPDTAQKIFDQLGISRETSDRAYEQAKQWGGLAEGTKVARGESLFPRLE
ncbi:MAG: methionine--tRNA ligase [bacterium]|nr:methionine--tRNA ligase [bacterium]